MLFIQERWEEYFRYRHEGLGTTYERFILHRYFEKLRQDFDVQNVLEVPSFGMTGISGINSMWWADQGINVSVVDDNLQRLKKIKQVWQEISLQAEFIYHQGYAQLPFKNKSFDLSWNFAGLWFVTDLDVFFSELVRVTKKTIFLCVPNTSNIFCAQRIHAERKDLNLHLDNINPGTIKEIMKKLGWQLKDSGYFDVPPWPDIAMNKEEILKKIGLRKINKEIEIREKICILDYFNKKNLNMEKEILKYGFLENSFLLFKKLWAHHRYFIFKPGENK
ncbi:MAG: methyltransferase domain-containing protein [Candidatus Omnitrophota bacterium]